MNILIINAFGSSPKAKANFESFCNIIKKLFKKVSKGSCIDNFNFICRSPNYISEFLYKYDMISGDVNQNKKNKKNFDKIDIVIIDGYEKYVPWGNKSFILCEFIKLCKITNKILYAGGVALEILIYYLATGSLNEYNFVNAKGQIKALEEMYSIPKKYVKELKNNDIFLDFVTGDILEYKNNETWVPIKNIGLHKQISAEKYMNRGKFVLPYKFRGKDNIKNEFAYVTVSSEIKVKITKQYLHHFLVDNLPLEFIAMTSLTWFPHFFNVNNKTLQFKVICESEKGPIIIEHQNSTGVLFHINEKYQETVIFLENFIKNKFNEVQNKVFKFKNICNNNIIKNDKKEMPLIFKLYNSYGDMKKGKIIKEDLIQTNRKTNLDKVNNSRVFNRIRKVKSEARHVGFGINNRDMIFVENNCINQNPFFYMNKSKKKSIFDLLSDEKKELNYDNILLESNKKDNNFCELKQNFPKFENQKNNNIQTLKNYHIITDNDSKEKKSKKRNLFIQYKKKNNFYLNNDDIKFQNNNLYLHSRNKNLAKKKDTRMKSANIFCKTVNNFNKKIKSLQNLEYNYPLYSDFSKKDKFNYLKHYEDEFDEYNDIYIPKYPRLANKKTEIKSNDLDKNLNLLLLKSKNNNDNNISSINNQLSTKNYEIPNISNRKNIYSLNGKNILNFNNIKNIKTQVIKTIMPI